MKTDRMMRASIKKVEELALILNFAVSETEANKVTVLKAYQNSAMQLLHECCQQVNASNDAAEIRALVQQMNFCAELIEMTAEFLEGLPAGDDARLGV